MKRIAAALIFFTRLPLWRVVRPDDACYRRIVACWPAVGWVTGATAAGVLYAASLVFPSAVAVLLALSGRVLLTGALHEDGLSDFLDGFGGGTTPERTLAIMKDSHAGSYGIIGLILYFLLIWTVLASLPVGAACLLLLSGDPLCKFVSSLVVNRLPYARTAAASKSGCIYEPTAVTQLIVSAVFGLLPLALLLKPVYWLAAVAPVAAFLLLTRWMRRRIGGYTGDCCGALFLVSELAFYLTFLLIFGCGGGRVGPAYFG